MLQVIRIMRIFTALAMMGDEMQDYEKRLLDEIELLKAENKGLREYSDSRDESIAVYREEIKELKAIIGVDEQ